MRHARDSLPVDPLPGRRTHDQPVDDLQFPRRLSQAAIDRIQRRSIGLGIDRDDLGHSSSRPSGDHTNHSASGPSAGGPLVAPAISSVASRGVSPATSMSGTPGMRRPGTRQGSCSAAGDPSGSVRRYRRRRRRTCRLRRPVPRATRHRPGSGYPATTRARPGARRSSIAAAPSHRPRSRRSPFVACRLIQRPLHTSRTRSSDHPATRSANRSSPERPAPERCARRPPQARAGIDGATQSSEPRHPATSA